MMLPKWCGQVLKMMVNLNVCCSTFCYEKFAEKSSHLYVALALLVNESWCTFQMSKRSPLTLAYISLAHFAKTEISY